MPAIRQSEEIISPLGPLPEGWRLVRLKDISKKVKSGATPRGGERSYLPRGGERSYLPRRKRFTPVLDFIALRGDAILTVQYGGGRDDYADQRPA
jgi:hypothetical protein